MDLREFMDMKKLQKIQDDFSNATGLAAIAVGKDGEYLTEGTGAVSSVTMSAREPIFAMRG